MKHTQLYTSVLQMMNEILSPLVIFIYTN